jgi:hypothetical protein
VTGQRRNVVRVQDELWRALRVAPGLVEMSDRVTRLNRDRGEISFQVTHSLDDLEALPTEADRPRPAAWPPGPGSWCSAAAAVARQVAHR